MQRHLVRPLILGFVAALLLAVGPAVAKIPYFSIEVSPADPVEGDVVVIVVRMWDDAAHTQPASWGDEAMVEGLLEFRADAGRLPIAFQRLDEASYRAEVTLSAGNWRLVPFPRLGGGVTISGEGYPAPVSVTVRERTDYSTAATVAAAGLLGILGLVAAGPARRWSRRARLRSATG